MREMPEINHCIPNRNAFWCAKCYVHSQFYCETESDGTARYSCRECDFAMFLPGQIVPWKNGLLLGTLLLGLFGLFRLPDEMMTYWQWSPACLAFAGFFGLIGGMMWFHMRNYSQWAASQRLKSNSELEKEANEFATSPYYEMSEEFDKWAAQFLSETELLQLHERFDCRKKKTVSKPSDELELPPLED